MRCPFCEAEMQEGYLFAGGSPLGELLWIEKKDGKWEQFKATGKRVASEPELRGTQIRGFRCDDCEKMILDSKLEERFF